MKIVKANVPFTILVSIREINVGDRLAADCFGKGGQKVAREGDEVDRKLKERLRNMKVRKAWVERTIPEWMPPSEAQLFDFSVAERHEVSPLHYQILINFQGTFSTHGIDKLIDLFKQRLDTLSGAMRDKLETIEQEFEELKPSEERLRNSIQELDDDQLKSAYRGLLSTARPQAVDPSKVEGGQAAIGRRIQSFLESLQRINSKMTDLILELDVDDVKSLVQMEDVEQYEDTSNFLDSFVLFERLYQIPTIEDKDQVQTLFRSCLDLYRSTFYENTLDHELLDEITELLWDRFDPNLPHWIMSLGQGGEPEGYLMAHSVNTAILTSQLYRQSEKEPETNPRAITLACLLMDIGMVLVPQCFHLHDNELSEEQRKKTRIHPLISKDFYFDLARENNKTSELILKHHERIDGTGYPRKSNKLNRDLRLITVCDMFEAMSSPRMWRSAMPPTKVFKILKEEAGKSLDETWVNHLINEVGIYPVGSMVRLSNDKPAVVIEHNPDSPTTPTVIPVSALMNNSTNGIIPLWDSDLSIQAGGTGLKAPIGIRQKLIS